MTGGKVKTETAGEVERQPSNSTMKGGWCARRGEHKGVVEDDSNIRKGEEMDYVKEEDQ